MIATSLDTELAAFMAEPITHNPQPATTADGPPSFLDGITEGKPKAQRSAYPPLPDTDGTAAAMGQRSIELADSADMLKTNNRQLGEYFLPHWFRYAQGKTEPETAMRLDTGNGPVLCVATAKLLKMTTQNALNSVRGLFAGDADKRLFFWTFDLSVDSDNIPPANQEGFVTDLRAICAKHGAKLEVKKEFKAKPNFFTERHVLFTPEQNLEINRAMPLVTSVKVKGVK
jgi:hypothetical protein